MKGKPSASIDEYIQSFPLAVQKLLKQLKSTISKAAPEAKEAIKYSMPAYVLNGNLVYFAAFANHIGFYPIPSAIEKFKDELKEYTTGKGSVQFPIDRPLPLALITRMVKFRVEQNKLKPAKKK